MTVSLFCFVIVKLAVAGSSWNITVYCFGVTHFALMIVFSVHGFVNTKSAFVAALIQPPNAQFSFVGFSVGSSTVPLSPLITLSAGMFVIVPPSKSNLIVKVVSCFA